MLSGTKLGKDRCAALEGAQGGVTSSSSERRNSWRNTSPGIVWGLRDPNLHRKADRRGDNGMFYRWLRCICVLWNNQDPFKPPSSCCWWRPGLSDPSSPSEHHCSRSCHGLIPGPAHPRCYWRSHPQTRGSPDEEQVLQVSFSSCVVVGHVQERV